MRRRPRGGPAPITTEILAITPNQGAGAGGETIRIYCTRLRAGTVVTIGGNAAAVTDGLYGTDNPWVEVTTPAHAEGQVDVVVTDYHGTDTAVNGFEYTSSPTGDVWVDEDFEDGTIGVLRAVFGEGLNGTNTITVSTDQAASGTKSAKCNCNSSLGAAACGLTYDFGQNGSTAPKNPMLEAEGLFIDFDLYIPTASINALTAGASRQMKFHLLRLTTGSGQPGYAMGGVGDDFGGDTMKFLIDNGTDNISGGDTGIGFGDGVWRHITLWMKRSGGVGRVRCWIDDVEQFDVSDARLGSDDATKTYRASIGAVYVESGSAVLAYVDNVRFANFAL